VKTLAYVAIYEDSVGANHIIPIVFFLRGDHELNEAKLTGSLLQKGDFSGAVEVRPMTAEEIVEFFGCIPGYLGPDRRLLADAKLKGKRGQFYVDNALKDRSVMIAGANREGYHRYIGGDDLPPRAGTFWGDWRLVNVSELDRKTKTPLRLGKAVEIGHIFKLGYKYSKSMGATVLDKDGKEVTPIMGSYGIGIERILTAAIESSAAKFKTQFPDVEKSGEQYALPTAIAPFEVVVTITNVKEANLLSEGEKIATELSAAGLDVLLDDRDERAGVKFKDAELIGVPYRINIGKKLAEGQVELVDRLTGTTTDITVHTITAHLQQLLSTSKL
jgi:prolyl-tRNA synthetase